MLLSVAGVEKHFGTDIVLDGITFRLDRREKVALVGRNGAGKTTLLRILTGQETPTSGSVQLARGAKVGYLRQEQPVSASSTVLEEAEAAVASRLLMKARLEELEARLLGHPTDEELEEYALVHEHFLENEGYSAEREVRVVLQRMGFTEEEFGKAAASLSGGEKTRLALARLLLEEPDLLILDEPTNHLDLQATEWLEGWVQGYHGAVLLVSHDRTFLERTAERTLEMRGGKVFSYPGGFAQFLRLRAEEDARLAEVAKRQDQEIAKLDEYVRRFMNSQRTAQARGRLKKMNRLLENRVEGPAAEKTMKAGFGKVARSGDIVLDVAKFSVGYPPAPPLITGLDWTVRLGDRWGVVGENGAGKSTLIKAALDLIEPVGGRAKLGSNVQVGYFAQDVAGLDPSMTPLDYFVYECDLLPAEARDLLGRFLFSGDDVFRPIRTFSGGEKNKLVLARLVHENPNLLVLDEPTNHLDMASREALAEVLQAYKGTLILISHDRWLLESVTDHTLDVRRGGCVQFPGSYADYRRGVRREEAPKTAAPTVEAPKETGLSPRELSKEIVRMRKVVEELESQVEREEAGLKQIEATLANLPADADILALTREHQARQESLAGAWAAWEENASRLEALVAQQEGAAA